MITSLPSCALELYGFCLPFRAFGSLSVAYEWSGIHLLTSVKPGGKNFPLTSVETSAGSVCLWGKLLGIGCVTVKRGLFSWSCQSAEDIMLA